MKRPFSIGLVSSLLVPGLCLGEIVVPPAAALPTSGSTLLVLVRMLGALILVLGVFLAGLWVFRYSQRLAFRQGAAPRLSVIEAKSLGPRHTLYLVACEKQRVLLAASPAGVTLLTALPAAEEEERPAVQAAPTVSYRDFPALFLQALGRKS